MLVSPTVHDLAQFSLNLWFLEKFTHTYNKLHKSDPEKIKMIFCSWAKSSLMSYLNKCIPKIHPFSGEVESVPTGHYEFMY